MKAGTEDEDIPLVVDLDGTLIKTDILLESLIRMIAVRPLSVFKLPLWLTQGKAAFKARIAEDTQLNLHTLPVNESLVAYIEGERARGRRVYLASASDRRYVEPFAERMGLFVGAFASDGVTNLGGRSKAELLCREFGEGGFDYAADAKKDLRVWERARRAIAVNCSPSLLKELARRHPDLHAIASDRPGLKDYLRELRLHQWVKNVLLFVPMLTAHAVTLNNFWILLLAFLSFSLIASSVYVINDLLDLPNDRDHASKKFRPFASGVIPIAHGLLLAPALLVAGILLALLVSPNFLAVMGIYFVVTFAYSLYLKRKPIVDVMALAGLYTVRLIAGAVALALQLSEWLLAFSMFFFLSLALIKRYTELKAQLDAAKGKPAGRGYRLNDLPLLEVMAAASGYVSVVVMALYVNSSAVTQLYTNPQGLWGICILLFYWISRALLLTHRGDMHDDPIVFALKDPISLVVGGLAGVVIVGSTM